MRIKYISVDGIQTIKRTCTFIDPLDPIDDCYKVRTESPDNVKIVFCETCDSDGCNSATKIKYFPLLVCLSILIKIIN